MENNFDKKISNMLNDDIYIPQKITNTIKTSLNKEPKGIWLNIWLKKVIITMASIIMITSVVFAGKIYIEHMKSTKIAKDYGYFEDVNFDYIINDGLGIKLENYFIDQGKVGVTFNIQTPEKFNHIEMYSTDITESNTYYETIDGTTYVHWDESESGLEYNRRFDIIRFIDENRR